MARPTNNNIAALQIFLLNWFEKNGRKFPWRKNGLTNYQIIIAETLLQRTKAETVSSFYSKFIKEFPNWKSLATAKKQKIENYLKPIGLYRQRAKRLKYLATEMKKRNGKLPKNRNELETISFFGQYIINAIELLIFKKHSPLLDVNMARVIERYFGQRKMADIRYDPYLQNLSRKIIDNTKSIEINWAILDFSALICKVCMPLCNDCGIKIKCFYYRNQIFY